MHLIVGLFSYFYRMFTGCHIMAKVKRNTKSKKVPFLTHEKQLIKDCTVKLKRLSADTIKRLTSPKHITHNIVISIHGHELRSNNTTITSENLCFDIEMKVMPHAIEIVDQPHCSKNSFPDVSTRSLRPRVNAPKPLKCNSASKRTPVSTIAKSHPKPIQKLIDSEWLKSKKEHKQNNLRININDIVLAKVRGYNLWPAVVLEFTGKSGMKVEFFGADDDEKFGFVSMNEVTFFKNSAVVVRLILKRNIRNYRKAIKETEILCGIPSYASLCNE